MKIVLDLLSWTIWMQLLTQGLVSPFLRSKMEDADVIFHCIALHHTILKSKAELDDLCSGLDVLGVRDMIKNHPDLLRPFFTDTREDILTAGI